MTFCVEENNPLVIALNAREGTPFKVPVKPSPHGYDELMRSCCSMQRDDRPAFSGTRDVSILSLVAIVCQLCFYYMLTQIY